MDVRADRIIALSQSDSVIGSIFTGDLEAFFDSSAPTAAPNGSVVPQLEMEKAFVR
jgi:hypothetical protein